MTKLKLLITDKIDESGLEPLKKHFKIEKQLGLSPAKLQKIIADYHILITRSSTPIPENVIKYAKNLKLICRAGIGVDNIDIFSATKARIGVINAPQSNALVTAEHTIGLIFALLRHIPAAAADLKKGIWGKQKYLGNQIQGKVLGIVGFGNVGREVYRMAVGVGMKVVVCEPYIQLPRRVKKLTYEELLRESDIITFHVPLTYLTSKMINRHTVNLCKKGTYIVNCSRGAVVDEEAVYEALISKKLAGFAVDVYKEEPVIIHSTPATAAEVGMTFLRPKKFQTEFFRRRAQKAYLPAGVIYKLMNLPNVIATPHIAGSTVESQKESIKEVVTGICEYLEGRLPVNLLNPQVFRKNPPSSQRYVGTSARRRKRLDFDAVIFDCDSTLSDIEGIDELAGLIGKKEEIAKLTLDAMEGRADFESIYAQRLKILKPHKSLVEKIGGLYKDSLIADTKEVIEALHLCGKKVYIISGGFSTALYQLGKTLGISEANIFGNDLIFDEKGNYESYIEGPLRRNHGKLQILRQIEGRKIMIGDSLTDLETKECVDLFVGFGGVVRRKLVEEKSDLYLYCKSLLPVLLISIGEAGCKKLIKTKYRRFIGKGLDLLFHPKHVKRSRSLGLQFGELKKLAYY